MPTPPSLPSLPGLSWNVHKKPTFSTRVSSHTSGREVRAGLYARALYEFELEYEALDSNGAHPNLQSQSLQTLLGFYLQCQGQLNTFLYTDPNDNTASGQNVGTGDGTTKSFILPRTIGGFSEPASYVTNISSILLNGTPTGAYTFTAPNIITFTTAPGAGVIITANFTFAFQCRFMEDQLDFENVMKSIWSLKSLKFRSVR